MTERCRTVPRDRSGFYCPWIGIRAPGEDFSKPAMTPVGHWPNDKVIMFCGSQEQQQRCAQLIAEQANDETLQSGSSWNVCFL